jgi:protein-S-isoprenylcysteine O-methyltransferase Ste14
MGNDILFRMLLLLLFVSFVSYRGYCTRKYGRSNEDTLKQRGENLASRLANLLSLPGLIAVILYIVYPSWISWASLPLPIWLRWIGAGAALSGFALLQWAHQALGNNWSDAPRLVKGQVLVTGGPYRWIRHPIYTAFLLIMSATLFLSANWFIGILWVGMTALEVLSRIKYEEALMAETFGEQYRAYTLRTGRLLPRFFHPGESSPLGR